MAKYYRKPRLAAACALALQIGACQYGHVPDILSNKRSLGTPPSVGDWVSLDHAHMRGSGYYQ